MELGINRIDIVLKFQVYSGFCKQVRFDVNPAGRPGKIDRGAKLLAGPDYPGISVHFTQAQVRNISGPGFDP